MLKTLPDSLPLKQYPSSKQRSTADFLWDAWCITSLVGIWPRFIEPRLVTTTVLTMKIKDLPAELNGLKILQFSDLHFHDQVPSSFLERIYSKVKEFAPDIIVFTGDFICQSVLEDKERLLTFLNNFPKAPFGNFAILGNHDYSEFVSVNDEGVYDIVEPYVSHIGKAIKRLFKRTKFPVAMNPRVKQIPMHEELINLIKQTPFQLLHNSTQTIQVKNTGFNICGVGEYMLGRFDPETAFKNWDPKYTGIILAHNPDCAVQLSEFPGALVLSGHTHGGQVNLPWINNKFVLIQNRNLKQGMVYVDNKWVYINRGIGSVMPFRWFAPPELLCLTLDAS